jgi:outer membrane lipoprotein-sorting protein
MSITSTIIGYTAWVIFAAAELEPSEDFQSFLDQRDAVKTLTARFHQETIAPDELIESEGSLVYINPKRILFRYDKPLITYMIDAERNYEYDEENEQLVVYDLDGGPEAEAFFLGFENNRAKVLEAYSISSEASDNPKEFLPTVVLTPKTDDPEELFFERVYMKIKLNNSMPSQIIIINDEENKVIFYLDEYEINTPLQDDRKQLHIAEGTEIIINDEYVGQADVGGKTYPEPKPDLAEIKSNDQDSDLIESETLDKVSNP